MTTLTSLPQELIDLITSLVAKEDYFSCVHVNHAWNALFTPYIWREVRVVAESGNENRQLTVEARKALARNGHYVHTIETTDPSLVFSLVISRPYINNLESLTIHLKDHPVTSISELVISDNIVLTTATCLQIERLDIHRCSSFVATVLQNNPGLRFLSLDEGCFHYKDGKEGFVDLVQAFPKARLEKLELSFRRDASFPPHPDNNADFMAELFRAVHEAVSQPVQTPFFALTELSITSEKTIPLDPRRLTFLLRCPNLERIRLARLDDMTMKALPFFLRASSSKELRLPDMQEFGADGFEALMNHAETLEVLKVESAERLEHNAVVDLLCAARNLRRLEGPADGERTKFTTELMVFAHDTYLDHAQELADRNWALGPSMEHLQLCIEGVPRPDISYRQSGEPPIQLPQLDPALRFDVQRWIYTQLNRMVNLQELILGITDFSQRRLDHLEVDASLDSVALEEALLVHRVCGFNYGTMEFSLQSGLGLLAGLRELRLLDVRRTAHRIGAAELAWMHTNWPKLETIRGLESNWRWAADYEEGPAAKAAVDAWMAAHPRGIGSSFYL
ncbi:hypothetical protein BGZ95_011661 [Linnemannia exigua]|uniref:F-box domain-containing protein n=1 Tax=Linnemannia exigua TaxID=604196 RepID=A0AAD4DLW4_9FUNG|nr:hypothetical protein BGZ95_011661 [Linnemannia exigua]